MHNGAHLLYTQWEYFGNTAATNAIWFWVEPDGPTGPGEPVSLLLYYDGKFRDWGTMEPNTKTDSNTYNPNSACVPSWFNWN